ncbi:hypothetical protein ACHAXR_006091 [Thalassiosira sp. AJA248-18]
MWRHVEWQMRVVPGGLGDKMEDWVELAHQAGARRRRRFRTTKNAAKRARASAKVEWRDATPSVMSFQDGVDDRSRRKFKVPRVNKAERQKAARAKNRLDALRAFQLAAAGDVGDINGDVDPTGTAV